MKQTELEKIYQLSAKKKNGVYSYAGHFIYGVIDLHPVIIGDKWTGEVSQISHGFLVSRGKVATYQVRKTIVKMFKEIENDR